MGDPGFKEGGGGGGGRLDSIVMHTTGLPVALTLQTPS
jgi:hypothetical protein